MKPVRLLPEAQEELEAAAVWYEGRSVGLGAAFADEVEAVLGEIGSRPHQHARWAFDERYQKLKTSRFPYLVFYEERAAEILVVAIAHGRRRPGYWLDR